MKKLSRAGELLWLMGVVFVALGVAVCSKADLGVSMIAAPAFVVHEALASLFPGLTVGITEYLIQGLLLLLLCAVIRRFRFRYLLAFAVSVVYGYTLDLFLWLLAPVNVDAVWLRWVLLLAGDGITAFGVACFFGTYLPLQVYELFVAEAADRFRFEISRVKWAFDLSLLAVSVCLALVLFGDIGTFDWSSAAGASFHSIGLGTLVTTAINSPIIRLFSRLIDRVFDSAPRFPGLMTALRKNG